MTIVLRADQIEHRYGREVAARLDSLEVPAGRIVGLVGTNGVGKSTLLRLFALLEAPTHGRVILRDRPGGVTERERARRRAEVTLYLPQPYLYCGNAVNNVQRGLVVRGVPKAERQQRAQRALADFGADELSSRDARKLSTGQAARVALARATVLATPLLLLDEPFANLDAEGIPKAREALRRQAEQGTAIVATALQTGDLEEWADEIVELRK